MADLKTWSKLKNEFETFLLGVFTQTEKYNLDVSFLDIDHAGLRFRDPEDVNRIKAELLESGAEIISSEVVNGREILILKLPEPFEFAQFRISYIELPYPASEHKYHEDGWEHIEFVIESDA